MSKFKVGDKVKIDDSNDQWVIKQVLKDLYGDLYIIWRDVYGYRGGLCGEHELELIQEPSIPISEVENLVNSIVNMYKGTDRSEDVMSFMKLVTTKIDLLITKYKDK